MNEKQKRALWVGIILMMFIGIVPPWITPYLYGGESLGFSLIFDPPHSLARPDISRLLIEWAVVAFMTGGLLVGFRKLEQ